jgi:hypothetical protein
MRVDEKRARGIGSLLYDEWRPLGANPPADEYERHGPVIFKMLVEGASREDVAQYLRDAAAAYGCYPVPEERLARVVDKLMSLREED